MIKVYEYGCLEPIENLDWAMEQTLKAHDYRNRLTELEVARRTQADPIVYAVSSDLSARVAALTVEIASLKGDRTGRLKGVRAALKALRPAFAAERQRQRAENAESLQRINAEYLVAQKQARAESECWFGHYLHQEIAHMISAKRCEEQTRLSVEPLKYPVLPEIRRYDGTGCLAVQIPCGAGKIQLACSKVMDGSGLQVRIETTFVGTRKGPIAPDPNSRRSQKRKYCLLWMRIDTLREDGRPEPIWLKVPIIMHRPLPPDGVVTWCKVFRQRIGLQYRWRAQITVKTPDVITQAEDPRTCAGIGMGWVIRPDGLHVASLIDSRGHREDLVLPLRLTGAFKQTHDINHGLRKDFENMVGDLTVWMAKTACPQWLTEATDGMRHWERIGLLARVARMWVDRRFDGDAEMFERLMKWRVQNKHLLLWARHGMDQTLAQRRDIYRCFARRIADAYSIVAITKEDLRVTARRRGKVAEERLPGAEQTARRNACLSSLRVLLRTTVEAAGGRVIETAAISGGIANEAQTLLAAASGSSADNLSGGARDRAVVAVIERKRRSLRLPRNKRRGAEQEVLAKADLAAVTTPI